MTEVSPLPGAGAVFFDERDDGRSLRVSWHAETATFVLSVWRHGECAATFRLAGSETPRLVYALTEALTEAAAAAPRRATG